MLTQGLFRRHNLHRFGRRSRYQGSGVLKRPSEALPWLIPRMARESKQAALRHQHREPSPDAIKHPWAPSGILGPPQHCKLSGTYKELQMNTKRVILAATFIGLLLVGMAGVAAAQDFNYIADPRMSR